MAKFAAKDSNKNITLSPHGTGKVVVGTGATDATVQSDGNHNLVLQTGNSTTGSISITDGADGGIAITPNGTGEIVIGSGSASGKITSSGAHDLVLDTNAGTNSGSITITDGADANINIVPNGTGEVYLPKTNIEGGAINGVTIGTNSVVTDLRVDNLKLDANTISSTNTDGNIDLTPNGTGEVNISKVDIDSGTIDGTTIATSDVTVGSGKTLDVSAGTLTTSTAQKQAIVDGATIEAQDLASGSGTTLPNNVQDAITRLGTVTSGTIDTGAQPSNMSYYVSTLTRAHSDSGDITLNTSYGFGTVIGAIALANNTRIRMHIYGGLIEYDAGSSWGSAINYKVGSSFTNNTDGTFTDDVNWTNAQSTKLTSNYINTDYINTSGGSVDIYFRAGMFSTQSTTARWYALQGQITYWYELIKN